MIINEQGEAEKITSVYARVIGPMLKPKVKHDLERKHRAELFGAIQMDTVPERFWELQVIQELPGGLAEWESMDLYQRTERIVARQLSNMIQTLNREAQIRERNEREEARANEGHKSRKTKAN